VLREPPADFKVVCGKQLFLEEDQSMANTSTIPAAEPLQLSELITPTPHGIASRILLKNNGGSLTLFAFDAGQGLAEHTAPFDAIVMVLDGRLALTIGSAEVLAPAGTVVRMPANVPHAVDAPEPSRMLLTMLREPKST
jgi:quercetin dioxygenase-like cupin family protein